MWRKRSPACLAVTVLMLALAGCSGDDGDAERDRKAANDFSLAVERITDDVDGQATITLTALNEVADNSIQPRGAIVVLERVAKAVMAAETRLKRLDAPAATESTADSLESVVGGLARNLASVATDIRVARRGLADLRDAAFAGARLVLSGKSGVSALSRALRSLVDVTVGRA